MTQAELARRSGLAVRTVRNLERGVADRPRRETVRLLASALGLEGQSRDLFERAAAGEAATGSAGPGSTLDLPALVAFAAAVPGQAPTCAAIPRELPRPLPDFTGRNEELARLIGMLGPGEGRAPVVICAIDGMGGVGKSTLALQAAHGLTEAGAFPDGQLYVSLQGTTAGLPPLAAIDALSRMLRSLGVDPAAIPGDVDEAAARLRSLLAGRRVLLLLDNAHSVEQVRPLLPGAATCSVVITSRYMLAALEGAHTLHLDLLGADQALDLLGQIAGAERILGEPEAAAEVVRHCGGLPLAIRIAGARLAARPGWCVRELSDELADATNRLEGLRAGDLAVRASFDVSLRALEASGDLVDRAAAGAFGLLSLPNGPELGVAAAARLLDQPEPAARRLLERLLDARLLESPRPGRYRFHDLVRLYARDRQEDVGRWVALTRVVGFYTVTVESTAPLLRPGDVHEAGASTHFADAESALDWLETERTNLLAAISQAADEHAPAVLGSQACKLTRALLGLVDQRSYWRDWEGANRTALGVACRAGDVTAQAHAHNGLGLALAFTGRPDEAVDSLQTALALFRDVGNRPGQAAALTNLGMSLLWLRRLDEAAACLRQSLAIMTELDRRDGRFRSLANLGAVCTELGQPGEAVSHLRESLTLSRDMGHRRGEALALNTLARAYLRMPRYPEALAHAKRSLAIFRQTKYLTGEADALRTLGLVCNHMGRYRRALPVWRAGLDIYRRTGNLRGEAMQLGGLGDAYQGLGDCAKARTAWRNALEIMERQGMPEAGTIRGRLDDPAPAC